MIAGSENFSARAGSFVYIPGGTPHSFRIDSDEAQFFNWYLPGGFEAAITSIGEATNWRSLPPTPPKRNLTPQEESGLFDRVGTTMMALPDTLRQNCARS